VQVTPNSTHVPPRQLAAILELPNPHILSASEWGTQVIANSLVDMGVEAGLSSAPPIHTVHHGISGFAPVTEELDKTHDDFYEGKFRVVHFSTTEGERKGTLELLQAWPMFLACGGPVSTELILVLDYHARMALKERMNDIGMVTPQNVLFLGRGDLDAATMSGFLCRHHLVCAPSRGEGFSLAPLESRACGVPVVTTTSTGNSAGHCEGPGVIPIHQNPPLLPIDDGPGALALAVEPGCIAEALALARGNWLELSAAARKAAPQIARDWSWQKQLAPLVEQLR
jgi:glycosyltransferase involved in cell wall biosynthesis